MFNNFLEYEYMPYHKIYQHQTHNNFIYLGDVSAALDIQMIKSHSIRTVVTAAIGMDHVCYDQTINHIIYPLLDMKSQNITKFFIQFYDLIEKQIAKGNILVHCAAGISRSATLVISYLMKKHKWGFKQAIQFVRQKRPAVCPNLGFQRQLKQYEVGLNRQNHLDEVDLRMMPKSSQARKHGFSPIKAQMLPQIGNFGHTQILRSKALQKYQFQRLNKNIIPFTYSKNRVQNIRKSQHEGKLLKKKALAGRNQFQDNIERKNQLVGHQKNFNFINMFNAFQDDRNPLQINSIPSKKLSSLSHRSQRVSQQSKKLKRNFSNVKNAQNKSNIDDISNVIVNKLNLHQKHFVTQKILRSRPLYKLANF